MEASTKISKKVWEGKQYVAGSESLKAPADRMMPSKVSRLKLKLYWRPQEVRDAMNVENL